ncbi:MAG: hypothetical protein EWV52_20980 [Microcystis panniformis Mp_MB_F_20051200_S6D]|nr:MAG: hypothetical protein EWV43_21040 [Microcystis panniformis Mp_MB_F_20080800_S26D]TRV60270.1 MAG: hypothetical protein EWV86_16725 [Microcystis panniformis Mp_MB_F_20051200_S9D]TRV68418.1 MAG: hypothetical protein EWV52_20980 [Microcystis panniformis Mp_MB_F_20051200_S6D]
MDKVLKTCLSPALDDNYLSKNNASTQVLYLNKRILSDFFQNENCCSCNFSTISTSCSGVSFFRLSLSSSCCGSFCFILSIYTFFCFCQSPDLNPY